MLFKRIDKATGGPDYRKVDVTAFYGDLPLYQAGINVGRLAVPYIADNYGWSTQQVHKARQNWVTIFRFESSTLTFKQYLDKLKQTGLNPDCIGNKHGQYNLARKGDRGGYTETSCRFVTRSQNIAEQHLA